MNADESSKAEKPMLNAWQSALLAAALVVGVLYLATYGLHALALGHWLNTQDIYLLIVCGAGGLLFLLIALAGRGVDVGSAIEESRKRKMRTNPPRGPAAGGDEGDF